MFFTFYIIINILLNFLVILVINKYSITPSQYLGILDLTSLLMCTKMDNKSTVSSSIYIHVVDIQLKHCILTQHKSFNTILEMNIIVEKVLSLTGDNIIRLIYSCNVLINTEYTSDYYIISIKVHCIICGVFETLD